MDGIVRGVGVSAVTSQLISSQAGITSSPVSSLPSPQNTTTASSIPSSLVSTMMATNKTSSPVAASGGPQAVSSPIRSVSTPSVMSSPMSQPTGGLRPVTAAAATTEPAKVLDKRRLQELVKEVDPLEQLDDEVEDMLMLIADDFIDNVVSAACQLAKHRKSNTVEVKDVQLHLERSWNMWIPGFGSEELKPYKKSAATEAHKQRLALIKKTLKKY